MNFNARGKNPCPRCGELKTYRSKICHNCRNRRGVGAQQSVLLALVHFQSVKEAAYNLKMNVKTFEWHLSAIKNKLKEPTTIGLVNWAWRNGLVYVLLFLSLVALAGPPRPNAKFVAAPTTGYAPLTVTFTNQTTGNAQWYFLSFGDNQGTSLRPWTTYTHIYNEAGSFNATLTVSNKTGFTIAEQLIIVTNRATTGVSVTLAWNPSTSTNINFYTIYMGFSSSNYSVTQTEKTTNVTFNNLVHGTTYFFNVDCTSSNGLESAFNHEISYTP